MQPNLGLNLKGLVFQPINPGLIEMVKGEINDTFQRWMPFIVINNLDVSVYSGGDDGELMGNTIKINLHFGMKSNPQMHDSVEVEITGG